MVFLNDNHTFITGWPLVKFTFSSWWLDGREIQRILSKGHPKKKIICPRAYPKNTGVGSKSSGVWRFGIGWTWMAIFFPAGQKKERWVKSWLPLLLTCSPRWGRESMRIIEWMKSQLKHHCLQSVSRHNVSLVASMQNLHHDFVHIKIICIYNIYIYISWKINLHATRFLPSKRVPSCQPSLSRGFPQGRKKAQSFLSAAQEALPTVGVDVWKIEVWDNLLRGAKRGRKDVAISFQICLFLF